MQQLAQMVKYAVNYIQVPTKQNQLILTVIGNAHQDVYLITTADMKNLIAVMDNVDLDLVHVILYQLILAAQY